MEFGTAWPRGKACERKGLLSWQHEKVIRDEEFEDESEECEGDMGWNGTGFRHDGRETSHVGCWV